MPNPGGRLGDAITKQTTADVKAALVARGYTEIKQEVKFAQGSLGMKDRYADIVAVKPATGESVIINIGKQTKKGIPIMRERMALTDILVSPKMQEFGNSRVLFIE